VFNSKLAKHMTEPQHDKVLSAIGAAFPEGDRHDIAALLASYAALPHAAEIERVQLAIIELSGGSMEKLRYFVDLALTDYRDVLACQQLGPISPEEGKKLQAAAQALIKAWGKS
jgi:hypothetical protein